MRRRAAELVLWAFLGALTGYAAGETACIYENWPAPPADYVWSHTACR